MLNNANARTIAPGEGTVRALCAGKGTATVPAEGYSWSMDEELSALLRLRRPLRKMLPKSAV